jgi:hypothetical protein
MMKLSDLWHRIETGAIVTFITLLIWLFAEGESVRTDSVAVTLQFTPPVGQSVAISPRQEQIRLTYRASTRQQQQFQQRLREPLEIPVEPDPDRPLRSISLRDRLRSHPAIDGQGIELITVDPEALLVRAQKLTRVTVPVAVVPGTLRLSGSAMVNPSHVELLVPDADAAAAAYARVEVQLDQIATALPPGQSHTLTLPVTLPQSLPPEADATPAQVEVTFTTAGRTEALTLPHVRIMIQAPPRLLGRYEVRLRDDMLVLPEPIEVVGPVERIETLRATPDIVVAVLRFTAEELASAIQSKTVELNLPEGVTARTAPPRVSFAIIDRQSAAAEPTTNAEP